MNFKISYAITACDEYKELENLLGFLFPLKRPEDEIVVQVDKLNCSDKVLKLLDSIEEINYFFFPLNNDFATFKNNLKKICKGDYIFQIDADELPAEETVKNLHKILESNVDIDLFLVPRVNVVRGITDKHIEDWGWEKNENQWINWPDYQSRIFKNNFNIKWKNSVHEYIDGASTGVQLPATLDYALTHVKDIKRQEKQNSLYNKL